MASKILDDPDGLYLENDDSLDEVDATKIFKVTDVEAIAPNFVRDVAKNAPWKRQRTNRARSVHKNWGSVLESEIKDSDLSVLLTLEGEALTETSAKEQGQMVQDALAGAYCQTTRWDESHLMLHLPNYDIYTKLGQLLSDNKVKAVENIAISSLEGANMCNPPRVLIEHTARQREPLLSSLVSVVLPFSPAFTFLELFVDSTITVTPPAPTPSFAPTSMRESVPNLCLTMLFEGGSQRLAQRSLESIVGPPWQAVPLNSDVLTDLDTGLSYHRNTHGGPMWGIKTGCPQAGVQLTLFINDLASFDAMVRFYQGLLDLKPLSKIQTDHGIVYRVFPLSARGELMLLHIPGLETHPAAHVTLCLSIDDLRLLPPEATPSHSGRWSVQDPNGNNISILRVLK